MKGFKKIIAILVAVVLVCSQIPFALLALGNEDSTWSDTNLVEGQENITLNDYFWDWLPGTLKGENSYKYNFNVVTTTTAGYLLPTVALRDSSAASDGTEGLYVVFNVALDQIRIGYENTTNASLLAVATASEYGVTAGSTFAVEIISTPTTIEVFVNGTPVSFYDFVDGQMRTTIAVSGLKDGKAGFNAQGMVLDTQITDIAIYGEVGSETGGDEEGPVWSDTNLVEGQQDITLTDYFWDWLPGQLDGTKSYKYSFNIVASATEGYRLPTIALRDSSANSDGTEGLYIVFYGVEDQIRIGYEATTFTSLIGVAKNVGMGPAGTYAVEVISTPETVSVTLNGTPVAFYDYSDGQTKYAVSVSGLKDGKAGFNAQGNVMDTKITDIAIYGEEEQGSPWSETNLVEGQEDITLTDYVWDWLPGQLDATKSYKYNFNIVASATEGYRLPTIALRDSSAASDGTEGLYVVFNASLNQVRIGYENTTNASLIAVGSNIDLTPAGTYEVEIISTPETVAVTINGTPVSFFDMRTFVDGITEIEVSGLKDGKAGFNAQGNVLDTQITDIAIYGESGSETGGDEEEGPAWSDTNLVEGQQDITLTDYFWDWLPGQLDGTKSYKYNFKIVASETAGFRLPTIALRDSSAGSDGTEGLYVVFHAPEDQVRIGYEYTTNASLIAVAQGAGIQAAGTYEVEIISTPTTVSVSINGTPVSFYDFSVNSYGITEVAVSGLKDGKAGFNAQGNVMDTQITNIAIYEEKNATTDDDDKPQVDAAAVENVIALINAIGTVSENSGDAIAAARNAYNALNDDEKALVTNFETLNQAEMTYSQITASQDIRLYSLSATDAMGYNHWLAMLGVTNVTGGGMKYNWKNAGTNMRQGINRSFKLDGLHAVFSGWEATSGSKSIAIYLADLDPQESYTQMLKHDNTIYHPLALIINGADGTLGIASAKDNYPITVIATSDNLKYEALAGKEWSMFMKDNGDGSYTVTVNGVSGVITKAMFDACDKLTQKENVYMTICPWDWAGLTTGSLNVISLHDGDNVCANNLTSEEMEEVLALVSDIAAIGIVTKDSKQAIEACEAKYQQLNDIQKGCVTNYNVLMAARYRYDQLTQDVDEPCLNYYSISTADLAGINHWPDVLFYNDVANGGVKFEWINGGTNVRRLINREVTLDGLHMLFSGLNAEDSVKKFALYCADLYDTAADWTSLYSEYVQGDPSILALIFDFNEGTLTAHVEGESDVVIIKDSRITYEYLKDVTWELQVKKNFNGDYEFTVAGATGVLPAKLCDKAYRLTNCDNSMYVTMSPWNWMPYNISVDVLAIHGKHVVCAEELTEAQTAELNEVIKAIDAIYTKDGKIVPASEEKFVEAWDLYDSLAPNLQPLVANYSLLEVAEEVLDVVLAIEDIGTVTYESGDYIEEVRQMYKNLALADKAPGSTALQRVEIDVDKRLIVGNYSTLQAAITEYYNLRKELDLSGDTSGIIEDAEDENDTNDIGNTSDALSPSTGDVVSYSVLAMALASMVAVAMVYLKKNRKES